MLTPQDLERSTHGFRRGYREAVAGQCAANPYEPFSFAHHDYEEGYRAGANDMRWAARREAKIADRVDGYDRDDLGESPDY